MLTIDIYYVFFFFVWNVQKRSQGKSLIFHIQSSNCFSCTKDVHSFGIVPKKGGKHKNSCCFTFPPVRTSPSTDCALSCTQKHLNIAESHVTRVRFLCLEPKKRCTAHQTVQILVRHARFPTCHCGDEQHTVHEIMKVAYMRARTFTCFQGLFGIELLESAGR